MMRMPCDRHEETVPLMESNNAEIEGHLGIPQPVPQGRPTSTRMAEVGPGIEDPEPNAGGSFGRKLKLSSRKNRHSKRNHGRHGILRISSPSSHG